MISNTLRILAALIVLVVATACNRTQTDAPTPTAAAATQASPISSTPSQHTPRVSTVRGDTFLLELAIDDSERARGLMFRPKIPADQGMLFLFDRPGIWPFWMKNVIVPLDLIYLDETGRIVEIMHELPPCPVEPCPSFPPDHAAIAVLEIAGGRALEAGIEVGQRLRFEAVPGYPSVLDFEDEDEPVDVSLEDELESPLADDFSAEDSAVDEDSDDLAGEPSQSLEPLPA